MSGSEHFDVIGGPSEKTGATDGVFVEFEKLEKWRVRGGAAVIEARKNRKERKLTDKWFNLGYAFALKEALGELGFNDDVYSVEALKNVEEVQRKRIVGLFRLWDDVQTEIRNMSGEEIDAATKNGWLDA